MDKKLKAAIDAVLAAQKIVSEARDKERAADEALDALCPYKAGDIVEFEDQRARGPKVKRKLVVRHARAGTGMSGAWCWYLTGRNVRKDGTTGSQRLHCHKPMEGLS